MSSNHKIVMSRKFLRKLKRLVLINRSAMIANIQLFNNRIDFDFDTRNKKKQVILR